MQAGGEGTLVPVFSLPRHLPPQRLPQAGGEVGGAEGVRDDGVCPALHLKCCHRPRGAEGHGSPEAASLVSPRGADLGAAGTQPASNRSSHTACSWGSRPSRQVLSCTADKATADILTGIPCQLGDHASQSRTTHCSQTRALASPPRAAGSRRPARFPGGGPCRPAPRPHTRPSLKPRAAPQRSRALAGSAH